MKREGMQRQPSLQASMDRHVPEGFRGDSTLQSEEFSKGDDLGRASLTRRGDSCPRTWQDNRRPARSPSQRPLLESWYRDEWRGGSPGTFTSE